MSTKDLPALKPYVRQTPGLESYLKQHKSAESPTVIPFNPALGKLSTDPPTVDDIVNKLLETIPAEMLDDAIQALGERTRKRLSLQEIRERLENDAADLLNGRAERLIDSLHSEFDEELRDHALSMADEDAELAIEDGEIDDFISDLAESTIQEDLLN